MNFLAHSLLAFGDEGLLVGQFAGEFDHQLDLIALGSELATVFDRLWPEIVAASQKQAGISTHANAAPEPRTGQSNP